MTEIFAKNSVRLLIVFVRYEEAAHDTGVDRARRASDSVKVGVKSAV